MLPTDVKCRLITETAENFHILLIDKKINLASFFSLILTYFREI